MERLTFDCNFCDIAQCMELPCPYNNACTQRQVWERLKQYEDSGLSPIACEEARKIEEGLSEHGYSIERMVELMQADKDGRVVVLPCKVGSTMYRFFDEYTECTHYHERRDDFGCCGCEFPCDSYKVTVIRPIRPNSLSELTRYIGELGTNVFLTYKEAERKLAELKGDEE